MVSGRLDARDVPLHLDARVEPVRVRPAPLVRPSEQSSRPPSARTRANRRRLLDVARAGRGSASGTRSPRRRTRCGRGAPPCLLARAPRRGRSRRPAPVANARCRSRRRSPPSPDLEAPASPVRNRRRGRAPIRKPCRETERDFSPVTVFVPVRGVRLREFVVAAAHGVLCRPCGEIPGLHYSNCGKDGHGRRSRRLRRTLPRRAARR